jgi:predicted nucleic acid-binding protein
VSSLYLDTGALLKLYVEEPLTNEVHALVAAGRAPIPCHEFHRLEAENAVRLKVFRGEFDLRHAQAVVDRMEEDLTDGRLHRRSVDWTAALIEARRLAQAHTPSTGCRSLDLLHIAVACQWECSGFLTLDDRQARAASAAGLDVIDPRISPA